jgi:hypothetical protein
MGAILIGWRSRERRHVESCPAPHREQSGTLAKPRVIAFRMGYMCAGERPKTLRTVLPRAILGADKEALLAPCDLFVSPSISENFGNSVF